MIYSYTDGIDVFLMKDRFDNCINKVQIMEIKSISRQEISK